MTAQGASPQVWRVGVASVVFATRHQHIAFAEADTVAPDFMLLYQRVFLWQQLAAAAVRLSAVLWAETALSGCCSLNMSGRMF